MGLTWVEICIGFPLIILGALALMPSIVFTCGVFVIAACPSACCNPPKPCWQDVKGAAVSLPTLALSFTGCWLITPELWQLFVG
jgi:hypothetical protein